MIRIGIAEDHQILIDGLRSLLEEEEHFTVPLTAVNGKLFLEGLVEHTVDVVLMDINMPELSGIEATKLIKARFPDIKVLFLSMHNDLRVLKELLKVGADGYLIKDIDFEEIKLAIETVYNGDSYFSKSVADNILKTQLKKKRPTGREIGTAGLPITITPRESEVLQYICMEYTSSEIAGELYISFNTVETHRKKLLNKLNCKNSVGLVKYALEHGLV